MKKRKSGFTRITTSLICTAVLFGCSNGTESKEADSSQTKAESLSTIGNQKIIDVINKKVTYDKDDLYSDWKSENYTSIQLNGTGANAEGDGEIQIDGSTITIKTAGIYVLSGKLNDGQINIDTEDKGAVRLVLNGANITSSDNASIYVKNVEKTVISLQKGTENHLSDGEKYVYEDSSEDEPDSAIFSKADLTINGSGKLIVKGNYNNGIASKDELRITGGNIQIDAADDGLIGRDLLAVKEGSVTINAGGDGIKSTNDKDSSKGAIAIEGGTFNIKAVNDGIQAETSLLIADGDFTIFSGGGSPETIANREGNMPRPGQEQDKGNTTTTSTDTETESAKGLKAAVEVAIGGGTLEIDSSDDAVHSNNSITITDGNLNIASGDDGIHADSSILTKGGNIKVTKSYEGIESKAITIAEGNIHVNASDDGINIGGGNDGSGMDMQADAKDSLLTISGGYVYVNSQGDGLDSNGSISMTDGTVVVSGPTMNGNGSLDYDQSFEMSGGFLIATGSSGMAQASSEESTQNSVLMTFSETKSAGTVVHLEDSEGNGIVTFNPEKDYQSVFISSPKLKKDTSYTLYSEGSSTGNEKDGLYTDGDYQDGTKVVEFKISDSVTWLDESGITTAKSEFGPGGMGNPGDRPARPEGGTPPDDMFGDLDDETKEKMQAIMEKERAGTITSEEAQAQLKELGIEFPGRK